LHGGRSMQRAAKPRFFCVSVSFLGSISYINSKQILKIGTLFNIQTKPRWFWLLNLKLRLKIFYIHSLLYKRSQGMRAFKFAFLVEYSLPLFMSSKLHKLLNFFIINQLFYEDLFFLYLSFSLTQPLFSSFSA